MSEENKIRAFHQRATPTGRIRRAIAYFWPRAIHHGGSVNLITPPKSSDGGDGFTRRQEDKLDWKTAAPRWLLLIIIPLLAATTGWYASRADLASTEQIRRLQIAIDEMPAKSNARLSERVAVVEEQQASLRKSVDSLTVELKAQNVAVSTLTTELRLLTAEIRQANRRNGGG